MEKKTERKWRELIDFLEEHNERIIMKDDKQILVELIGLVDYLHPKRKNIYKHKDTGEVIENINKLKKINAEIEEKNKKLKRKKKLIEYITEYEIVQTYITDLDVLNFYLKTLEINYTISLIELDMYEKKEKVGNGNQYTRRMIPIHWGWKIEKINSGTLD